MEGNQQKMREAFNKIGNACAWIAENCNDQQTAKYMNDVIAMVQSALSAPPRNCDVGTADGQVDRHREWCNRDNDSSNCCNDCRDCFARWAQMPYEAEGAEK